MIQSLIGFLKKIFFGHDGQHRTFSSSGAGEVKSSIMKMSIKETQVLQPAYTVRLKPESEQEAVGRESDSTRDLSLTWCGLTDTGKVRNHNEDFFSCTELSEGMLFIVADGMGGHDAGEVASKLAVETVCLEISKGARGKYDAQKLLTQAVQRANAEVLRQGANRGSDMGTTITLGLINQNRAHIASVGDSRTYWIENGSIKQITEDHTLVAKLVSAGKLTKEQARNHPKSNLLYRTVGSDEQVKVDTFQVDLKKGGSFLFCSDGLWNEVTDEEMHGICNSEKNIKAACGRLITTANEKGGRDNITAVIVRISAA